MKRIPLLIYIIGAALSLTAQSTINVAVMSINDFHGSFVRDDFKHIPGAAAVVETLDSLKKVYPLHIVVSAGDNFGGSYFYQATRPHTLLPQFFKDCGIRLSGIGNHEFDEGQPALLDRWHTNVSLRPADWDLHYVSANIRCDAASPVFDGTTSRPPFCEPTRVETIALPDGRNFRLAFLGLTTSSTPLQASKSKLKGLSFCGDAVGIIDSLSRTPGYEAVRQADARLILTHQGTRFAPQGGFGTLTMLVPRWDDADSLQLTRLNDPQFCAIISGHSHQRVSGTINEINYPVIQAGKNGQHVGITMLELDSASLQVLSAETRLVEVTPKALLSPKAARLQAQIEEQLATTRTRAGTPIGDYVTTVRETIPFDRVEMRHDQTRMGQLVTRSFIHAARRQKGFTDRDIIVGVSHIGCMRSGLSAGPVRVLDIGEVLPFDNAMKVFRLTGKQLRDIIDHGLHNERYGYLQFAPLTPQLDKKGHVKALTYHFDDGSQLKLSDTAVCYVVADEFLAGGGDGFNPAHLPESQMVDGLDMPHLTDVFINYLKTQKEI